MITQQLKTGLRPFVTHKRHFPQFQIRVNSLPAVVIFLSASITLSLVALILAARTGAVVSDNMTSALDPFAHYLNIMPGQPAGELSQYPCQQPSSRTPSTTCSIVPAKGSFHLISVASSAGHIAELSFFSEFLQLGDLIQQWGEPDAAYRGRSGQTVTMIWDRGTYRAAATILLATRQPHVQLVTLRIDEPILM